MPSGRRAATSDRHRYDLCGEAGPLPVASLVLGSLRSVGLSCCGGVQGWPTRGCAVAVERGGPLHLGPHHDASSSAVELQVRDVWPRCECGLCVCSAGNMTGLWLLGAANLGWPVPPRPPPPACRAGCQTPL